MYMSNLAEVLESLDSGARVHADTTEQAGELYASDESPLTVEELETLLGPASPLRRRNRKRLRFVRYCDNFSGEFRPFRVR